MSWSSAVRSVRDTLLVVPAAVIVLLFCLYAGVYFRRDNKDEAEHGAV